MDHYSASLGWQPLFIVAGIGVVIIAFGVVTIVLQQIVSFIHRKELVDNTGDPWNGRTLEWSIPSPAPFYDFSVIPTVHDKDQFWVEKETKVSSKKFAVTDILLPINAPESFYIGMIAIAFGFAMVWHIWWLSIVSIVLFIVVFVMRLTNENPYYLLKASQIKEHQLSYKHKTVIKGADN